MPVFRLVLRPDEEAYEEEVDDYVCRESPICHVHIGGNGRYKVRQDCTVCKALLHLARVVTLLLCAPPAPGPHKHG